MPPHHSQTPQITGMRVVPMAGHDSMLLNLSGAHAPFFTRNLLILSAQRRPHGAWARCRAARRSAQTLEDARELIVGRPIGAHHAS